MDRLEAYLYLFSDSFIGSLIVPPHSAFVRDTMLIFGGYGSATIIVLIALIASILGAIANYLIGMALVTCARKEPKVLESKFMRAVLYFKKYELLMLLFSGVPFIGNVITVISGTLSTRFKWFMLVMVLSKLLCQLFQIPNLLIF